MIFGKEGELRGQIIDIGRKLHDGRLVVAKAGNLSARLEAHTILITATGTSLADLEKEDIIKVNIASEEESRNKRLSSEFPLHSLIYKDTPAKVIIHCHPPLVNGYFAVHSELKNLTFESKLYLGNVPLVIQETPSITRPELVTQALKTSNIVAIKNHGVVAVAEDFKEAFGLIESLEEAVKIAAVARLFDKTILDDLDKPLKVELTQTSLYPMFSKEHIQAIVELVNKDEFIAKKGQELDLTVKLAIKMDNSDAKYKFNFEKGKIVRLDFDDDAPFIISGPAEVWEQVFLGKLDSFVAVTQGKMKLAGQLGQLSKWYVPFTRLFELFRQVKIK